MNYYKKEWEGIARKGLTWNLASKIERQTQCHPDHNKEEAAACPGCGGWSTVGGMSQYRDSTEFVHGRKGCNCNGRLKNQDNATIKQKATFHVGADQQFYVIIPGDSMRVTIKNESKMFNVFEPVGIYNGIVSSNIWFVQFVGLEHVIFSMPMAPSSVMPGSSVKLKIVEGKI